MSLIKCPECGKEISDKSNACINCGFPISEIKNTTNEIIAPDVRCPLCKTKNWVLNENRTAFICPTCGMRYEIKSTQEQISKPDHHCPVCKNNDWKLDKEKNIFVCPTCGYCVENNPTPIISKKNTPTCPKCGSTAITAGQRGFSLLTGFIGSNKTVNRCANCGHTWKP